MTSFQNYSVFYGIENLHRLNTCSSICFDTETTQLQPKKGGLRLIQLGSYTAKTIVVIDCFDLEEKDWDHLDKFFNNGCRFWLAHNAVFDLGWLQEQGIYVRGNVRCSFIANKLLYNGVPHAKHSLDALANKHLSVELPKEQQRSDWSKPELSKEQLEYAARDVEVLLELDQILDQKLSKAKLKASYTLECQALPAMAQMWRVGLPWNAEALQKYKEDKAFDVQHMGDEFIRELDNSLPTEEKLPRNEDGTFNLRPKDTGAIRLGTKKYAGFNIKSSKQLLNKLTLILGYTPTDNNGKASVGKEALRRAAADSETIQTLVEWKKKEKRRQMAQSIQEKMADDGFVRASYMQLGAETGRMSSLKPNNQQIPRDREFRSCVEAPEGWKIVDADFSQMELRLAAALANDTNMIHAFKEGADLHDYTAEKMGCDRQIAKSANFGLLYGAGVEGLRNYAGAQGVLMSQEQAKTVRDGWLNTYFGIKEWQRDNQNEVRSTEDIEWPEIRVPVTNMRRYLKGDLNRVTVRCNTPIQGAGAAILKCALGNIWPEVHKAGEDVVKIAAAVHDEILLLVKEEYADEWAKLLKEIMESAEALWLKDVPSLAEVKVGNTWEEVH